jgi:hypothetical protein
MVLLSRIGATFFFISWWIAKEHTYAGYVQEESRSHWTLAKRLFGMASSWLWEGLLRKMNSWKSSARIVILCSAGRGWLLALGSLSCHRQLRLHQGNIFHNAHWGIMMLFGPHLHHVERIFRKPIMLRSTLRDSLHQFLSCYMVIECETYSSTRPC